MSQYTLKVEGWNNDLDGTVFLGVEAVGTFTASTPKDAEKQARAIAAAHKRDNAPMHRVKFERDFSV